MSENRSVSPKNKLKAVEEYLSGNGSTRTIAQKYRVSPSAFRAWITKYRAFGNEAFIRTGRKNRYTKLFKETVVKAYLNNEGSLSEIAVKFKIPASSTVIEWVLKYNSHECTCQHQIQQKFQH